MTTDRRERFKKIAVNRTNKVLNDLRLLGNCANKSNYEYTQDEVKKILSRIETELKITKGKFNGTARKNDFEL